MTFLWIGMMVIMVIIVIYIGHRKRLTNQYAKKQETDRSLYRQVLKHLDHRLQIDEAQSRFELENYGGLLKTIQQATHFPLTENDQCQILLNGEQKFAALIEAIEQAQHHIHFLYFTIRDDDIGGKILDKLQEKAEQGVEVRILVDGVGSVKFNQSEKYKQLKEAGVECATFAPPKLKFILHLNFRNHRKIVVIDGRSGFIGGLNIGDEYLHRDPKKGFWRDIHCYIEGESALLMQRIFATDWYYVTHEKLTEDKHYFPRFSERQTHQDQQTTALAQVAPSGPDMKEYVMKKALSHMILVAQKRVWLATPYFIPDKSIMQALKKARSKGVEVRLIIPKKPDHPLIEHASMHYLRPLLLWGARVYQYEPGLYHGKVALVDDRIVTIGSTNLDKRSLHDSFEANIFVYHKETTQQMAHILSEDMDYCMPLSSSDIQNRTVWQKMATQIGLLLSPWL